MWNAQEPGTGWSYEENLILILQCDQLETDQQEEEDKNCMLKRMLGMLTADQPSLPQKEVSAEEVMTIETFFERFEVEM